MSNATWMADMWEQIAYHSLRQIALPGTHDSATYALTEESELSPDAPGWAQDIDHLIWMLDPTALLGEATATKRIIHNWARTQSRPITEQLEAGIRFLDLRVCRHNNNNHDLWLVHSMYAVPALGVLREIRAFLDSHPFEIVLMQFGTNGDGMMNDLSAGYLQDLIKENFGDLLAPATHTVNVTPNYLWQHNQRAICIFSGGCLTNEIRDSPLTWTNDAIWSRSNLGVDGTTELGALKTDLQLGLADPARPLDKFFKLGCTLSVDKYLIGKHPISSLKEQCAEKATPALIGWLRDNYLRAGINIFTLDFFELAQTVELAIDINRELPPWPEAGLEITPAKMGWIARRNWRRCTKCQVLCSIEDNQGVCPAGGQHQPDGTDITLISSAPSFPGEAGWKQCAYCQALFLGDDPINDKQTRAGVCPSSPSGLHEGTLFWNYSLPIEPVAALPLFQNPQNGWRRCGKCAGLFFALNNQNLAGSCPVGGSHDGTGSPAYTLGHWVDQGDIMNSSPAGTCAPDQRVAAVWIPERRQQLGLVTVDHDGRVLGAAWPSDQAWPGWSPVCSGVVAPNQVVTPAWRPDSARQTPHFELFTSGAAGGVCTAWWEPGTGWQGWYSIGPADLTAPGQPITAIWRPGAALHLDLFTVGRDGRTLTCFWEPATGWHNWFQIGGGQVRPGQSITAVWTPASLNLTLFVVGMAGDIYSTYWNPADGWHGWAPISATNLVNFDQPITAVHAENSAASPLYLFTIDRTEDLIACVWRPNIGFGAFGSLHLDGFEAPGQPVAAVASEDGAHIDLFASGRDGRITTARLLQGDWNGWYGVDAFGPAAAGQAITAMYFDTPQPHVELVSVTGNGSIQLVRW